jgi:hypothetical protein
MHAATAIDPMELYVGRAVRLDDDRRFAGRSYGRILSQRGSRVTVAWEDHTVTEIDAATDPVHLLGGDSTDREAWDVPIVTDVAGVIRVWHPVTFRDADGCVGRTPTTIACYRDGDGEPDVTIKVDSAAEVIGAALDLAVEWMPTNGDLEAVEKWLRDSYPGLLDVWAAVVRGAVDAIRVAVRAEGRIHR